ncbi:hypothetical protein M426DRAFT_13856 [Hypoxylon sp. CI-4A]|nr:hypothetical protein M426DRAFT_13856 [Hypoxylon sp. CI-4A]
MSFSQLLSFATACLLVDRAQAVGPLNGTRGGPLNVTSSQKSAADILSLPLRRIEHKGVGTPSLAKRYFGTEVLGVYGAAYFAELTIGSGDNPQTVEVLLDTGSFELWVNPDCASSNVEEYCESFGHYEPDQSPTAQNLNTDFGIQYGQGNASGVYYKDDLFLAGAKVQDQQFGVSTQSSQVWFGILGLGYGQGHGVISYPSVVDSIEAQGYTESKLFSLDLGGQPGPTAAVTGEMVFGGVDTNKYAGNLAKVPLSTSDPHYVVTLNSLSLDAPDSAPANTVTLVEEPIPDSNLPLPVIIDSGTTLSLLPESMVSALAAGFPGATPDGNGGYKIPCDLRDMDGHLDFEFLGDRDQTVTITVSYADFIWNGGDECFLGATYAANINVWILGDTFLRGAYVTFDQTNNALYMANYVRCGEGSNLVAVPAGLDAAANIPGSCQGAAPVVRPASPADPDCTESIAPPLPAATTTTVNRIPAPSPAPEEDCDDDDDEPPVQRVAYSSEETFTATETFTSTMVRHVVYTMNDKQITTHETITTTFCPGDILPLASPTAVAPPQQTHIQPSKQPIAMATPTAASAVTVPQVQPTTTILTQQLQVTTTERPSTPTITNNALPSSETSIPTSAAIEACEADTDTETATNTNTNTETITAAIQTPPASQPAPLVSFSTYYTSLQSPPPPPQQSAVAYGGSRSWGFNNSTSSSAPPAGVAVASVNTGPSRGFGVGAVATPTFTPTPARTSTKTNMSPAPTSSGFILPPTSGADAGRGRIGSWMAMVLASVAMGVVVI